MAYSNQTKVMKKIGLRIKDAREKNFCNSQTAAKRWGVSPATWSSYEAGRLKFTAEKILELAEFLDCDPGWLLTGKEYPKERIQASGIEGFSRFSQCMAVLAEIGQMAQQEEEASQVWAAYLDKLYQDSSKVLLRMRQKQQNAMNPDQQTNVG